MIPRSGRVALFALLVLATPAFAQDAATPAQGGAAAMVRTPNPAGISDDADKTLWCGHALVEASAYARQSGDAAGGDAMVKDGGDLIAKGVAMLQQAGFDQARIEAAKSGYAAQAKAQLAGDGSAARYAYDECLVLTPAGAKVLGGKPEAPAN